MQSEPLTIDGIAGAVVVDANLFTGRSSITINGFPTPSPRRGVYTLPTVDGSSVEARVRLNMVDPYPVINIAGVKHRTGPVVPIGLRVLALTPLLLLIGGCLGGIIGGAGIFGNVTIVRTSLPTAVKALLMVLVLGLAALVWFMLALAINSAVS